MTNEQLKNLEQNLNKHIEVYSINYYKQMYINITYKTKIIIAGYTSLTVNCLKNTHYALTYEQEEQIKKEFIRGVISDNRENRKNLYTNQLLKTIEQINSFPPIVEYYDKGLKDDLYRCSVRDDTEFDITGLFEAQAKLDEKILEKCGNNFSIYKVFLSLIVELGELANETRCFKYWSTKECSPKEKFLEEYVDVLHFTLSIGNNIDWPRSKEYKDVMKFTHELRFCCLVMNSNYWNDYLSYSLMEIYNYNYLVKDHLNDQYKFKRDGDSTRGYYTTFLHYVLRLGFLLGFTEDEIKKAYYAKNEINYKRLQDGY